MADNETTESRKRIEIVVKTYYNDVLENKCRIDHNRHDDRVWLGKHCFWAMRNNRVVVTHPVNVKSTVQN